ncbi:hypothetical protein BamMEX5DRAFT_1276 [Burkholderia ambifaria MEX-5]|uniref:Uncharacterized protein n=1 Tax=Burkholderia ambifaria MEX-5 TaxID=396597 RepID=B1T0G0_9BURK|nr:hypothetical protein BamMEX5DRAFT_1276 [Burkholderia ambifaria MEX-5]
MFKVPKVLYADRRAGGVASDAALTHHATRMLHRVARDLRLRAGEHEVVAEPARAGRGCRVTLRTSRMMLEVADTLSRQQVAVSFRTRRGHRDLSGAATTSCRSRSSTRTRAIRHCLAACGSWMVSIAIVGRRCDEAG